jgi:hypothetical protein
MKAITAVVIVALHRIIALTEAWSPMMHPQQRFSNENTIGPTITPSTPSNTVESSDRRYFLSSIMTTTTTTATITMASWMIVGQPTMVQAATTTTKVTDAIQELKESRDKLKDIPDLLEAKEWDKVRSILKVPPVNKLWNLGDVRDFNMIILGVVAHTLT